MYVTLCLLCVCFTIFVLTQNNLWLFVSCSVSLKLVVYIIQRRSNAEFDAKDKGAVITGCDTGFGHDLALRLDELGFTVFAGCLHPDKKGALKLKSDSSERVHIVPLDVTSDESVDRAHDYISKHLPQKGLWCIINNAGFGSLGDVELLTIKLLHKIMNVNLYGAVRMIRTFLYLVRKSKGRVINVTSARGIFSWPSFSTYHTSKHALETLSDSLRLEMIKFGVKVSIIEPGDFSKVTRGNPASKLKHLRLEANEMWENASNDVKQTYGKNYLDSRLDEIEKNKDRWGYSALSTKPVVDAMVDAITSSHPKSRYLVPGGWFGYDPCSMLAIWYNYIPTWLSDWILIYRTGCDRFNKNT